ncbi:MAG: DUF4387 domain-containing protein [Granulosicoccus sp.]|nr:DUF4387 domain-containing protein [Granulosicoccus sp.]
MSEIGNIALKVRSKNAGPFWITVDVFCGDQQAYQELQAKLTDERVATLFGQKTSDLKRFDIPSLYVIKFSFPRPTVQGSRFDRDMHGAQWAVMLAEFPVDP